MMNLFAYKLSRLSRWRFSFFFITLCSFDCFWVWHNKSPLARGRARREANLTRPQPLGKSADSCTAHLFLSGYTPGEAQIIHLVMSLGNNLIAVDPHIAIPRQYVHVRL